MLQDPETIEPAAWRTERETKTFACDVCGAESLTVGWCSRCRADDVDEHRHDSERWYGR